MIVEREYWRKADQTLDVYPAVEDDLVQFPAEIPIAYAVCSKECGRAEFIVDGSTQICHYCGKMMFRTAVRKYRLDDAT